MNVPVRTILLYGRSIGSGPTCDLASKPEAADLAGVALQVHGEIARVRPRPPACTRVRPRPPASARVRAYSVTIHSIPLHSTPLLSTPRLQSPIASGARVVFGDLGVAARPLDIFTNYSKIGRVTRPVAIMHGTNDQVVPLGNGEALFNSLQSAHEVEHAGRW